MKRYPEKISDHSVWISTTPTEAGSAFPFYAAEAGRFYAETGYEVRRPFHESCLLLYTLSGSGAVQTGQNRFRLPAGYAALIDCRKPHSYRCEQDSWEFLWFHLLGKQILQLLPLLFPVCPAAVRPENPAEFESRLDWLLQKIPENDLLSLSEVSETFHALFTSLLRGSLETEQQSRKKPHGAEIEAAVDYIRRHYSEALSIDDLLRDIPLSKYHFIRIFRRIMGSTPYQYLMNYRISQAKTALRSSDLGIGEIAFSCGFTDVSNFIAQFRKQTGQTPSQYRKDFG